MRMPIHKPTIAITAPFAAIAVHLLSQSPSIASCTVPAQPTQVDQCEACVFPEDWTRWRYPSCSMSEVFFCCPPMSIGYVLCYEGTLDVICCSSGVGRIGGTGPLCCRSSIDLTCETPS